MNIDVDFNHIYGQEASSSLVHCLSIDQINQEIENDNICLIKKSPYYTIDSFKNKLTNGSNFSLLSLNVHSLNAKIDELKIMVDYINDGATNKISAIVIQETWLSDASDVSLLNIDGYKFIGQNAVFSRSGGLAVYLDCDYDYNLLPLYNHSHFWEGQFLEIFSDKYDTNIKLANIYRKPIYINESYHAVVS